MPMLPGISPHDWELRFVGYVDYEQFLSCFTHKLIKLAVLAQFVVDGLHQLIDFNDAVSHVQGIVHEHAIAFTLSCAISPSEERLAEIDLVDLFAKLTGTAIVRQGRK